MFNLKKLRSRKIGFCCEQDWILLAAKSIVAVQGGAWFACGIVVRGLVILELFYCDFFVDAAKTKGMLQLMNLAMPYTEVEP